MKRYWSPDKITALVIVVGCFALLFTGIDGEIKSILAMAAAWLFGGAYQYRLDRKSTNDKAE